MDISKYTDAVTKQKADLSDYVSKNVAAIVLPQTKQAMIVGKKNFNTISAWVYLVIGFLAFIIGLIVGISGIWITGCASLLAGGYLWVKGRQELHAEAYNNVGDSLVGGIDKVLAYVSLAWTKFVNAQNESLRKDIVSSQMTDDGKVAALGLITDSSYVHLDMEKLQTELKTIDADEKLKLYEAYKPVAVKHLDEALTLAADAQSAIFKELSATAAAPKPAAPQAAAAPKPAAPQAAAAPKPAAPASPQQPSADTKNA